MPNGNEMLGDLEFEKLVSEKSDRALLEFVARQSHTTKKDIQALAETVSDNKRRTFTNRAILIILIVALVCLGIINSDIIPLLGF